MTPTYTSRDFRSDGHNDWHWHRHTQDWRAETFWLRKPNRTTVIAALSGATNNIGGFNANS